MNFSDLNNLDTRNMGGWPFIAQFFLILFLCALILGAGYWFDTRHQWEALKEVQLKEQDLRQSFEIKQAKAANLLAYQVQMQEMKKSFGAMLRQLPSKSEVADLLVDISQTGLASGLSFELFSPKAEVPREFYAELPILMRVTGNYHELGSFVSGVAALPRIVTLHDTSILQPGPTNVKGNLPGKLVMDVTAKTYRYLDEPNLAPQVTDGTEVTP